MRIIILLLFFLVIIFSNYAFSELEHIEKNQVVIPYGSFSPVCAKTSTCYIPNNIHISEGDKIVWVNEDYASHTVTSGNLWSGKSGFFESEILNHNDRFEFVFNHFEPGLYTYYCIIHPWMKGIVSIDKDIFTELE